MGLLILSATATALFYQSNKIERLESDIEKEKRNVIEMEKGIQLLEDSIEKKKIDFERQIEETRRQHSENLERRKAISDKNKKDKERDVDKIFDKKMKLAEYHYNEHIRININNFNKGK